MSDYSDKYVLITGAAHGIGAAFAKYFAESGGNLLLLDIEKEKLAAVVAELPNSERHRIFDIDIGKTDQCEALFSELEAEGIFVEVLINNVGIGHYSLFQQTLKRIERIIDVNIKGTTLLTHLFLPNMLERKLEQS